MSKQSKEGWASELRVKTQKGLKREESRISLDKYMFPKIK